MEHPSRCALPPASRTGAELDIRRHAPVACNPSIVIIGSEGAAAVLGRSPPQVTETVFNEVV